MCNGRRCTRRDVSLSGGNETPVARTGRVDRYCEFRQLTTTFLLEYEELEPMPGLNVLISDEARKVLDKYQKDHRIDRLDYALDALLLEYAALGGKHGKKDNDV